MTFNIINCPDDANLYEFIVVRKTSEDEYFYVGKYTDEETAKRIAAQQLNDGIIIHNTSIKGKRKRWFTLCLDVEYDVEADSAEEAKEKFLEQINDNLFVDYVECYEDEDD